MVVTHTASCLRYVLHSTLVGTLHIVAEGEEGITSQTYTRILGYPSSLLLPGERLRSLGEELLPLSLCQDIHIVLSDEEVDGIIAVSPADTGHEGKVHHTGMLAQPPYISLVSCQACAVDTALLSSTDAYGLSALHIAHCCSECT